MPTEHLPHAAIEHCQDCTDVYDFLGDRMSDSAVTLRPVVEDDLSVLERFLTDPEAAGPFQWLGRSDPGRWRRRWAQDGLLSDDGGQLMAVAGADPLGFVAWRKVVTSRNSYCWNIGA